jgi:hypothetical protein
MNAQIEEDVVLDLMKIRVHEGDYGARTYYDAAKSIMGGSRSDS